MYEVSIHTADRGTIRREVADIDAYDALRDEWAGYATTFAINVYENGSELEWLRYASADGDHEQDFAFGRAVRALERASSACLQRVAMGDESFVGSEWMEAKERAELREQLARAIIELFAKSIEGAPTLRAAALAAAETTGKRSAAVLRAGLGVERSSLAEKHPSLSAAQVQLYSEAGYSLYQVVAAFDTPLYWSESEDVAQKIVRLLTSALDWIAGGDQYSRPEYERQMAIRAELTATLDGIR